jgi:protein phosphatase/serine/threonine-protein phosphatase Stp1
MQIYDLPKVTSTAISHPGSVRASNEDNMLSREDIGLWVVADGAGGHDSGEIASGMIVTELDRLPNEILTTVLITEVGSILNRVHNALRLQAAARNAKALIASTCIVLILRENAFTCLWVGDSRAYLLRQGELHQISRDHSLVQELVDLGELNPEDAEDHPHANVITRAVGADIESLDIDRVSGEAKPGDRFLLCSDGLSKTLTHAEIADLLSGADVEAIPELLVNAALQLKVRDNITALTVAIHDVGSFN